jgi:hypothetical protein
MRTGDVVFFVAFNGIGFAELSAIHQHAFINRRPILTRIETEVYVGFLSINFSAKKYRSNAYRRETKRLRK